MSASFLCKVTWLFEDSQGAKQTGFTRFMLEQLRTPINISVDGHLRSVGVPSDEEMRRCFQRMVSWLQLVRLTVKAELPSFESLQAFRIFDLDVDPSANDLRRLANMLDMDAEDFRAEFHDLRPSAEWHYRNGCSSSQAAWLAAVQKTRKTSKLMVAALARGLGLASQHLRNRAELFEGSGVYLLLPCLMCQSPGLMTRCSSSASASNHVESRGLCQSIRSSSSPPGSCGARSLVRHESVARWRRTKKGLRKRATDGNSEAAFLKKRRLEVCRGCAGGGSHSRVHTGATGGGPRRLGAVPRK